MFIQIKATPYDTLKILILGAAFILIVLHDSKKK